MRVRALLAKETMPAEFEKATLVCQYSSMGKLTQDWLKEFMASLTTGRGFQPQPYCGLRLVYPRVEMVRNSWEGYAGGNSLPVESKNWQEFLKRVNGQNTLCSWDGGAGAPAGMSGGAIGRQRSIPHIKTYTRFLAGVPHRLPWFMLTSANLSGAAWGVLQKGASQLTIRSYELGLLFLPSLLRNAHALRFSLTPDRPLHQNVPAGPFDEISLLSTAAPAPVPVLTADEEVQGNSNSTSTAANPTEPQAFFPVPYSLPPLSYPLNEEPWCRDVAYTNPDLFGEIRQL